MRLHTVRSRRVAAGMAAAALGLVAMTPRDAEACGGCFGPPTENASIVTDHRMILSISSKQTTLYDQIRYSGAPSSFAWVLPIADAKAAQLGLSADVVFGSLDAMTSTLIQQPPLNCPSLPAECATSLDGGVAYSPSAGGAGSGDVSVTKHEVVGPYVTDYVHSTDPQALNTWLTDHGYAVPADVAPVIAKYVNEHFDFIAMKLVPGQGVDSMRPVRVTTPGASPVLPLRMVAAGTGPIVGITLWAIGEGRYEPNNFKTFSIEASEITWDWTQNRSDYSSLRQQKEIAGRNELWEIESSLAITPDAVKQVVRNGGFFRGPGGGPGGGGVSAGGDYQPVGDVDGGVTDGGTTDGGTVQQTAEEVREADLDTLFSGITPADTRITRLRADLGRPALGTDLSLSASASQAILPNLRIAGKEANQPQCPVYNGCEVVGTAPRDVAFAETAANASASGETFACATAPQRFGGSMATGALAGLIGLAAIRSRRQRRR